jgi:hypothetical protein
LLPFGQQSGQKLRVAETTGGVLKKMVEVLDKMEEVLNAPLLGQRSWFGHLRLHKLRSWHAMEETLFGQELPRQAQAPIPFFYQKGHIS